MKWIRPGRGVFHYEFAITKQMLQDRLARRAKNVEIIMIDFPNENIMSNY